MSLNIAVASPEALPFAKTGGLADVAGSLPVALTKLGCSSSLFLPYYRQVDKSGFRIEPAGFDVTVPVGKRDIKSRVYRSDYKGVKVFFLKCDEYFDRSHLYGTPEGDYFDNLERYAFFSRGVCEALKACGGAPPDVIHCNDWQTGLIPAYLRHTYKNDSFFSRTATVFTIHNIAYQGLFAANLFELTNLSPALYQPEGLEFWGKVSLLKSGLAYSDILTTVSREYAREIQTPEYGYGLDGFLAKRKYALHGVLNGVDYDEWNPEKDGFLPERYSSSNMKGKRACKKEMLKRFGLKLPPETPVIGMISRLAGQKGFDILFEAMPRLMDLGLGMVIVGTGDRMYQSVVEDLAALYPERLGVKIAFDNELSHIVEAGADMFLMPSRYEPCGLNQIYSLRYGTMPIVRATGGLEDTVRDYNEEDGNGFKFSEYSAEALVAKVREALDVFRDKRAWEALQMRAMQENFSWENSAKRYIKLYAIAQRRCLKFNQASIKNAHPKKTGALKNK
ncbi:MAG: glycogen synthase GlgA [Deltaproteobacteria bacterium]|nr:glycogen synthase GlgA [Deltaproteobacteria bacterium]